MANGIAIKDVDNKLQSLEGEEVIPISTGANKPEVVEVDTLKEYINEDIDTALEGKQDVINDLATIRSGAALGATALQDSDISGWAKASTKPTYTVSEIDGAQEELESGVNIKTINNESILGSGNIAIQGGDVSGKEDKSNKVTSLSASSTDTQYPSAKCVWDLVGDIETILASI